MLNTRPRETLNLMTPADKLNEIIGVAMTALFWSGVAQQSDCINQHASEFGVNREYIEAIDAASPEYVEFVFE